MVIGRPVAQIEPHECDRRGAVRQHLDIAGDEPEMLRVPRAGFLEVGKLEHDVPEPNDFRGARRRPLRVVDSHGRVDRVERERSAMRQRVGACLARNRVDPKT